MIYEGSKLNRKYREVTADDKTFAEITQTTTPGGQV